MSRWSGVTDFRIRSSPALNKPRPCKPLPMYGPVATPLGGSGSRSWDSAHSGMVEFVMWVSLVLWGMQRASMDPGLGARTFPSLLPQAA